MDITQRYISTKKQLEKLIDKILQEDIDFANDYPQASRILEDKNKRRRTIINHLEAAYDLIVSLNPDIEELIPFAAAAAEEPMEQKKEMIYAEVITDLTMILEDFEAYQKNPTRSVIRNVNSYYNLLEEFGFIELSDPEIKDYHKQARNARIELLKLNASSHYSKMVLENYKQNLPIGAEERKQIIIISKALALEDFFKSIITTGENKILNYIKENEDARRKD